MSGITPLFLLALFTSASSVSSANDEMRPGIDGVWQSVGYGQVVRIQSGAARIYDVSRAGCVHAYDEPLHELGEIVSVGANSLIIEYGINRYRFERLARLPAACASTPANPADPLLNFDTVWHTFNEHYAFFDTRNTDWNAQLQHYRSQLDADSSDAALYRVLDAMLSGLEDSHVGLDAPENVNVSLNNKGEDRPQGASMFELQQAARQAIIDKYVAEVHSYNNSIVRWGWIRNAHGRKVAYIQFNAMLLLAQYPIEKHDDFRRFFGEYFAYAEQREYQYRDEVAGANVVMDDIVPQIDDADAVILDVRFNGGGKDGAGLAVMNHFVDREKTVFTKKVRLGDGFSPKQSISLIPAEKTWTGPVYLLTSIGTASAAEVMVLASMPLENVTRVGGRTEGIFSDTLDKKMPNGWEFTLSNEVYQDLHGKRYEGLGIPPHHDVNYPYDARAFYQQIVEDVEDGDKAIEWVLRQ